MYLNCHTYYSLRYGTLSPEELVRLAKRWEIGTLALTDINNTSCAYEFVRRCEEEGIKPILGIEFWHEERCLYIGLAQNAEGFRELNKLLTDCSLDGRPLPAQPPPMAHSWIIYPRLLKPIEAFRENELLGIRPEHVARLFSHELLKFQHKLVVLSPLTFADDEGHQLHRLLRAIDLNTLITKLGPKDAAKATERLVPPKTLRSYYKAYPKILRNTERVLASCNIRIESGLQHNRQTFTGSKTGDFKLLEKLALTGCGRRYGSHDKRALERCRRELRTIREQDFCSYFLITWDIVRYAQSAGYHHVGRGSGANSIVAYCLSITDVDPLDLGLYFERFINPYRASPPDFDIDFSWDERDDVTDYIFKRYGREHTALLATYSTFQGRSIVRELGKVFGLPKTEIDKIIANPFQPEEQHELAKTIMHYGQRLDGFPNHLSIHAGGILIAERPIHYHTALQMMPKGFPITHFDMHHAEELGFHKFDVLNQRGLGHIKDAVGLIKQNQERAVDVHDIARIKQDPKVKAQLRSGSCIGCFYIESPAMRGLLKKLRCDTYRHLVAASSIIRPGVAQSGMMKEYIRRFHQPHSFQYLHPVFEEHLGETFGVMVYQEDVMKIVHHFAGLGLDESDVLRRIMSRKKFKGDTFERLRRKFFDNCRSRGHSDQLAREVWRQVESFSGYSFCKAHSASFAVESFQSLYLKAYFPLEFIVAVINNFGGFYKSEYYFHEARMSGATLHPPCVNHSQYLTSLRGTDIYVGFIHLHGMEQQLAHRIAAQRAQAGPFRSLADFVSRIAISKEQLELLIRIGAFRFTSMNKYELMWEKNAVFNPKEGWDGTLKLFGPPPDPQSAESTHPSQGSGGQAQPPKHEPPIPPHTNRSINEPTKLPTFTEGPPDQYFDEMELIGFPLSSPFELLENRHCADCITLSAQLQRFVGRTVKILGYYVCKKDVRTRKGQLMAFGCWLGQDGHFFDTTHFPNLLRAHPFLGKGIYKLEGQVVEEFGFPSIEVSGMERLPYKQDERF